MSIVEELLSRIGVLEQDAAAHEQRLNELQSRIDRLHSRDVVIEDETLEDVVSLREWRDSRRAATLHGALVKINKKLDRILASLDWSDP